jgi:hypothetical protein
MANNADAKFMTNPFSLHSIPILAIFVRYVFMTKISKQNVADFPGVIRFTIGVAGREVEVVLMTKAFIVNLLKRLITASLNQRVLLLTARHTAS